MKFKSHITSCSIWMLIIFFQVRGISYAQEIRELNKGWFFRNARETQWYPATVPGTVHTDLLANGRIPDPFTGENESKVQWVDTCSWEYRTSFMVDSGFVGQDHLLLIFEGLDTYATVYLNDTRVLQSDNMFRRYEIDVKGILKPGENSVLVRFYNAVKRGRQLQQALPYVLPGGERVFTRKAAYQYGWDWGPRLITSGIWKEVKLEGWSGTSIRDVQLVQRILNDSLALMEVVVRVSSDTASMYLMSADWTGAVTPVTNGQPVKKGMNTLRFEIAIEKPRRWWCNGYGEPYLYDFTLKGKLLNKKEEIRKMQFGLRTLELKREKDRYGETFYFQLNGIPVFMKGANWIPEDNFLPRISPGSTDTLLQQAVAAHMNMLRVWGGGVYGSDGFYSLCDKYGILVWQDFMFAGGMYPADGEFLENVKAEVTGQILRLRNHPSLALWCGNNEIREAWFNWGWQKEYGYSITDSTTLWKNYLQLFESTLPGIVTQTDPGRPYWPSSPSTGWGRPESLLSGDVHYWGVWWGGEPFSAYNDHVGRFMSEYGFQGLPSDSCIRLFFNDPAKPDSAGWNAHQKHPAGYATIAAFMQAGWPGTKNMYTYRYLSQLVQADGIRTAIEAHRRARPYCMGSLFWQLNDCWPVVSWSSIDHTGNPKAVYYAVQKAFAPLLISFTEKSRYLQVHLVSDSLVDVPGELRTTLMGFDGTVYWEQKTSCTARSGVSSVQFQVDTATLIAKAPPASCVLIAGFYANDQRLSENYFYFRDPKDLDLPPAEPALRYDPSSRQLLVESKEFIRDLHITIDGNDRLPENFINVIPGRRYKLPIGSAVSGSSPVIHFESLNTVQHEN